MNSLQIKQIFVFASLVKLNQIEEKEKEKFNNLCLSKHIIIAQK